MKKPNLIRILPFFIFILALLPISCSKVPNVKEGATHRIVVIHSWDSIGEEKELFTETMEKAFQANGASS